MTSDTAEIAHRYYEEAFNDGNVDVVDELFAEEVTVRDEVRSREEVKDAPRRYNEAFEDLTIDIEETVSDGDRAALYWTGTGRHTGEYRGLDPSGEEVTVTGLSMFTVEDGRISSYVTILDSLSLLDQFEVPLPFDV